jgi:hypothetical protein
VRPGETTHMKTTYRQGRAIAAHSKSEVKFLFPDWGDKVDYGIELSYRPRLKIWLQNKLNVNKKL